MRGVIIGCHGRGGEHIAQLIGRKDIEIAYVCDVDSKVGNSRCEQIDKALNGHKPKYAQDLRRALDDKTVDFVTIATPNHWHSLAAIWAMQAGKDVYVEKPVSHNVSEGRRAVQTAARHKRICQTGMQSRSSEGMKEAIVYLRAGKLGEVKLARGLCYKPRASIGAKGVYQPPKEVDYGLWSGPAPILPLTRPKFHYDWHWQWPYGNGDIGNQGVHQMDIARWGLGIDRLANSVITYGGRFGYEDAADTPNTEVSIYEFGPDTTMVFEVRGLKTQDLLGERIGTILYGSEGYMVSPDLSSGSTIRTASVFDLKGKLVQSFGKGFDPLADHFSNFFNAMPQPQAGGTDGADSRRPSLRRAVPPGQHFVSPRQPTYRRRSARQTQEPQDQRARQRDTRPRDLAPQRQQRASGWQNGIAAWPATAVRPEGRNVHRQSGG